MDKPQGTKVINTSVDPSISQVINPNETELTPDAPNNSWLGSKVEEEKEEAPRERRGNRRDRGENRN